MTDLEICRKWAKLHEKLWHSKIGWLPIGMGDEIRQGDAWVYGPTESYDVGAGSVGRTMLSIIKNTYTDNDINNWCGIIFRNCNDVEWPTLKKPRVAMNKYHAEPIPLP